MRVAVASLPGALAAVLPVAASLRADPLAVTERAWLLTAAAVAALVEVAAPPAPRGADDLRLQSGDFAGRLILRFPAAGEDPEAAELAALAFDEHAAGVDRLRARAAAVPPAVVGEVEARDPIGAHHPLRVAEAVARLGGRPADPASVDELEDAVMVLLGEEAGRHRPHEDPDPARRVARRILQRLAGMGKWGGYHTAFENLARGFPGHERALATAVGEALVSANLLEEKPSVGQRHVFLNSRRAADIHELIETGRPPADLQLPS